MLAVWPPPCSLDSRPAATSARRVRCKLSRSNPRLARASRLCRQMSLSGNITPSSRACEATSRSDEHGYRTASPNAAWRSSACDIGQAPRSGRGRTGRTWAQTSPRQEKGLAKRARCLGSSDLRDTSFPGTAGCSWPTLTGGLWHFWALGSATPRSARQSRHHAVGDTSTRNRAGGRAFSPFIPTISALAPGGTSVWCMRRPAGAPQGAASGNLGFTARRTAS